MKYTLAFVALLAGADALKARQLNSRGLMRMRQNETAEAVDEIVENELPPDTPDAIVDLADEAAEEAVDDLPPDATEAEVEEAAEEAADEAVEEAIEEGPGGEAAGGESAGGEAAGEEAAGGECVNDASYLDSYGDGCEWYDNYPCGCGHYEVTDSELTAEEACCACAPLDCTTAEPLPATFEGGFCTDNSAYADTYGDGCDWYTQYGSCGNYDDGHCMSALESCCACIEGAV